MSYQSLRGLRVVDFGIITAGANTSALLADLGAEVIKVEGPDYIDPFRTWTGIGSAEAWWNESPHYDFTNRNKRSLCVDIKTEAGRGLLIDLLKVSDIVVENFRVGALDKLGLGFRDAAAANERIVFASISSQGATGPAARSVSFGSTLEASSGFSSLITSEAGDPLISGHALNYPDQIVSMFALSMILSALVQTTREPGPIHLDISQRELSAYMLGERLVAAPATDADDRGPGLPAKHQAVIRTADGAFVAYAVANARQTARIEAQLGLPSGRGDAHSLDASLERLAAAEALADLQQADVAAEQVRTARDLLDESTAASLAFARDPQARVVKGLPWRVGDAAAGIDRPAPCLGVDNRYVVCEVLGVSDSRYEQWVRSGVLATEPRAKERA